MRRQCPPRSCSTAELCSEAPEVPAQQDLSRRRLAPQAQGRSPDTELSCVSLPSWCPLRECVAKLEPRASPSCAFCSTVFTFTHSTDRRGGFFRGGFGLDPAGSTPRARHIQTFPPAWAYGMATRQLAAQRGAAILAQPLQRAQATQLARRLPSDQPRSQ